MLFIGQVGSGKTLSMTFEAYQYYRQGFQIYANYSLSFPNLPNTKKPILLTKAVFESMIEHKEQLQDVVLLIDEVHIWIDSRGSMEKKRRVITYFILQTRKRNVRLLATTQHQHQIDKRLRDSVDIVTYCENLSNQTSLIKESHKEVRVLQQSVYQWRSMQPKVRILTGNPVFPLFNTKEIIDLND